MQNLTYVMGLAFAGDYLESVAERDQPSLTAERTHLPNMVHVYNRVTVHPLELWLAEPILDDSQALTGQKSLLRRYDPNQLAIGLKGEDLVQIQEEVFLTAAADHLLTSRRALRLGRCNLIDGCGNLAGPVQQPPSPLNGSP